MASRSYLVTSEQSTLHYHFPFHPGLLTQHSIRLPFVRLEGPLDAQISDLGICSRLSFMSLLLITGLVGQGKGLRVQRQRLKSKCHVASALDLSRPIATESYSPTRDRILALCALAKSGGR